MENVLSFLNRHTEPWLSFGLTFLDTDPDYTFLTVAWLLSFLLLCYLLLKPQFPTLWKNKDIQKQQVKAKRRRSGRVRSWRTRQREAEEGRKLLSVLKSPLDQHCDITHFRRLLCPDPLCKVCNTTTAKVSRLLSRASLEDAADSVSCLSPIASVTKSSFTQTSAGSAVSPGHPTPASLTETFLLPSSVLPPNQVTSLADPVSPSAQGDSVPPEPSPPLESRFPVDQFPSETLATPPSLPHHTKEKETVLQPKATQSLDDSSDDLSTDDFSSAEASFGEHSTAYQVKPRSPSFLTSDNPSLLERDIKKTDDFLMCSEQEKGTKSFAKQHEPDYGLITSGERPELAADQQYSAPTSSVWISEGKPEEIHMNQKLAGPKNLEDHLEQKCSQFCHLLGLPRQSLNPLVPTSGDCFSEVSNISKAHESPVLPCIPPLSLPEVQPQSLSHTLALSQAQHLRLVQARGQLQSPTPVLPDSPLDQNRPHEVCFHSTQSEVQSLALSEIHNLEYNALQRVQESVWGLPSVVPKSQEDVCPSAFKLSSVTQSSKAHMPGSILPKNSTLNTELKKVEHHLQKKLIQHQWDLPPRALKSPSVVWVCPQGQGPVTSESKSSHGLSCLSLLKSQSSKDLNNFNLSQPSIHERNKEMLPLEKGMRKTQGYSPEIGSKDNLLSDRGETPESVLGSDLETKLESHPERLTRKTSQASCVSLRQKRLTKDLEVHLCKKFEEICKGHIPDTVNRSRYSTSIPPLPETPPLPEKSPKQINDRYLAPLVGKGRYLNTSQNISFISYSKQKMLEEHIKTFYSRMVYGLPPKVLKSTEIFNTKKDPSQALFHPHFLASDDSSVSGVHPKIGACKSPTEGANAFQAQNVITVQSVFNGPCPASSPVGEEGQGATRWSHSSTKHELTANIWAVKDGTQTFMPPRHSNTVKASQQQTLQAKRRSPRLPRRLDGAGPEIRDKRMSSRSDTEMLQSKMTKLDHFSVCNKSRETFKAQELCVLQSQPNNILTTKSKGILVRDVNTSKPETSLTTERPLRGTAVPQDLRSSGCGNKLFKELKFEKESRKQSQVQGLPTDVSLASSNFNIKTLFHHDKSVSCEDIAASQDNTKTHMPRRQKPHNPQHVLCKHQDKKFPSAEKRMCSPTLKTGDPGEVSTGLDAYQSKSCLHQDRTLEETHGRKYSSTLSLKRQPPSENLFKNKMKHFFQWLCPSMKHGTQESSKGKMSALSSYVQSRGLGRGRADCTGDTKDRKLSRGFAKFFRQNLQENRFLPPK